MGYLKYKGYTGSVEYSEEDNCLFGKVQGMSGEVGYMSPQHITHM